MHRGLLNRVNEGHTEVQIGTSPEHGSPPTKDCRAVAVVPPVDPIVVYVVRLGNVQVLYGGHPPEMRPKLDSVTKADSDDGTQAIAQVEVAVIRPMTSVPGSGQAYPERRFATGVFVGGQTHLFGQQMVSEHVLPEAAVVCATTGTLLDAGVLPPEPLDAPEACPDDLVAVGVLPEAPLAGDADGAEDTPVEPETEAELAEVRPLVGKEVNGSVVEQRFPRSGFEQLNVVVTGMRVHKIPEEQL
jgi:hypothetical protein